MKSTLPSHTYFVALVVRGIRSEARAASITEACRNAERILVSNKAARDSDAETAKRMIAALIAERRGAGRGAERTRIGETGASIEVSMDAAPKGWVSKAGPRGYITNWKTIPAGSRWQ